MTTTTCPNCGSTGDWYTIPEANLIRCPNCFATAPAPEPKAKPKGKSSGK